MAAAPRAGLSDADGSVIRQATLVVQHAAAEEQPALFGGSTARIPALLQDQQQRRRKWRRAGRSDGEAQAWSSPLCFSLQGPGAKGRALLRPRESRHRATCLASVALASATSTPSAPPDVPAFLELLPVGTHRGRGADKTLLRYVWDGHAITPKDESTLCHMATASGRLNQWFAGVCDNLYRAFLPDSKDVTPDYWEWLHWRLTQRFFSSTMQNLSTQSLLLALGMGAKKTIAASAAINWLLKDGVGRIARMTVATNFGQTFDSELKRIRFVTSVIFETTIGCEFITPFFPQHFLALASLANVGKAIALAAFVATAPAFQQALAAGGNLADLTAKNQAQHMLVDMLALGVSASAMYAAKNMKVPALLPLCAYPLLATCDLFAVYNELKAVQLRTLNRQRAEMVASTWIHTRAAPTPAQVSAEERLLLPPKEGQDLLPLRIVPLGDLLQHQPAALLPLIKTYSGSPFMMRLAPDEHAHAPPGPLGHLHWPWEPPPQPKLLMSLSESAQGADILTAVLEAVHLRKLIGERRGLPPSASAAAGSQAAPAGATASLQTALAAPAQAPAAAGPAAREEPRGRNRRRGGPPPPPPPPVYMPEPMLGLAAEELGSLVLQARQLAQRDGPEFIEQLKAAGWKLKPFLLSTKEKEGYVLLTSGEGGGASSKDRKMA